MGLGWEYEASGQHGKTSEYGKLRGGARDREAAELDLLAAGRRRWLGSAIRREVVPSMRACRRAGGDPGLTPARGGVAGVEVAYTVIIKRIC